MLHLVPHPDFPSVAVTAIAVDAGRRTGGALVVRFHVDGDLNGVLWPSFDPPNARADELWRHSCFEAFVGFEDDPMYCEFNFMAGRWAAYRFDGYRAGMRDMEAVAAHGHWIPDSGDAAMHFTVGELSREQDWRLGVSAIIEAKDGTKSYWALAHAPGPPDFHNPDCFIATLPAPDAT